MDADSGNDDLLAPLQQPQLLRQQVYDRIEEMIIRGTLQPGQHLVELELAEQLGVSRNPVREALQGLQRAGWIELRPRQGAFVRTPTPAEVEGFFRVRTVLEMESARSVARNCGPEDLERLRDLLAKGEEALEAGDNRTLVDANSAFHAELTRLTDNPVLADLLALLDRRLRWYFTPVATSRAPRSWLEHRQLVEAFAAGDVEQAAKTMDEHCQGTAAAYEEAIAQEAADGGATS